MKLYLIDINETNESAFLGNEEVDNDVNLVVEGDATDVLATLVELINSEQIDTENNFLKLKY